MKAEDKNPKKYALEDFKLNPISSLEAIKKHLTIDEAEDDILSLGAAAETTIVEEVSLDAPIEPAEEPDPIFKELSEPKLPELKRENRARLQIQSPTRIHFYWSVKTNPFQTLKRVFGNQTNYVLVAKLVNQTNGREEIFPIEAEGAAWFDTDANAAYQAEIGFYAVNRPFVRVMFSNAVETPRKNPSPQRDYSENFSVSAQEFAEVLDVSGYTQDAFEVALAGDDAEFANAATHDAFAQIIGGEEPRTDYAAEDASDMRFVLLALASGYEMETLRGHINRSLFSVLQASAEKLSAENARAALEKNFGAFADEIVEEQSFAPTVFGASAVNFPRRLRRTVLPKFAPASSFSLSLW